MQGLWKLIAAVSASLIAAAVSAQSAQEIRVGNVTANDTQAAVCDKFAELLTKYSGGRLNAKAFHGESLGNNAQMTRAMQAGSIHAILTPAGFMAAVVPEMGLFDLPFLLPGDPAGITAFAAKSKAAVEIIKAAGEKGIQVLGFNGIGGQSFLTNFPVTRLADIQGKKFRVIPSPPRVGAYKDWGAVARPMELGEVYTALQQRTLDGMENPPDVIYKMKHHEAAKYYTITDHFAFVAAVMVSKKWFDGLPKDLQDVAARVGKETIEFADAAYSQSQNASLEAMKKVITVTRMPAEEIEKMKALAYKGVWETLKEDPKRGPIIRLMQEDLAALNRK